jgi:hypothetical protein
MRVDIYVLAFALAAAVSPAFASDLSDPAPQATLMPVGVFDYQNQPGVSNDEGARAIEDAYAEYFSRAAIESGFLSVHPDGDAYVVTFDVEKAIAAAKAPPDALHVGAFSYRLKAEENGGWSWTSSAFPHIDFKDDADTVPSHGSFDFDGFTLNGRFDPKNEPFLTTKIGLDALKGEITEDDPSGQNFVRFTENDIKLELRGKSEANGAVDVAMLHAIGSLSQTVTPAGGAQGGERDVKAESDGSAGGGAVVAFKAREIGALWRAIVAGINNHKAPDALAALVSAALPLWQEMGADVKVKDVKLSSALGSAELAGFGETVRLSGVTDEGRIEFGVDLDGLKVDSAAAPPWVAQLTPLSTAVKVAVTDKGVAEAARLALKDPNFGQSGDLSPDTQSAIEAAIKGGDPMLVLLPGRLKTPIIDLDFTGSARIDPVNVSAEMKVSADSLDKTIALATELGASNPDIQGAVLALSLVKGLAKTTDTGRLFWDIVVEGDKVTVNGSPLPTGK